MEDIKKRPLSEEELEQVAGGVRDINENEWECSYCQKIYKTKEEAEKHEEICHKNPRNKNSQRLLKPIIL